MRYYVIGDEDTVLGFGMVGVDGQPVRDQKAAKAAFQEALADEGIGIIIITEKAADLIREIVDRYLFREKFPLIVEIPDREGSLKGKPKIREMVNHAIGIKL
jgi:V/A-type H+-transporting ATPase subunit F